MIICLIVSSRMQDTLNNQRETLIENSKIENAPPTVVFAQVALGGFRGFIADVLWLRAMRLHDEKKYFEAYQLAEFIVKLQARNTGAHSFLAWNAAYNISVMMKDPAERWKWVMKGVKLIRDEALRYNQKDPKLYKELGWIFQHKMGMDLDDANRYYKRAWAREMNRLLGFQDEPDFEKIANICLSKDVLDSKLALLKFPNFSQYLEKNRSSYKSFIREYFNESAPEEERYKMPRLGKAIVDEKIRKEIELFLKTGKNKSGELETGAYLVSHILDLKEILDRKQRTLKDLEKKFRELGKLPKFFMEEIKNFPPKYRDEVVSTLSYFLRQKWMKEVYKLDPSLIHEINQEFGNLDWRLTHTHAVYWAKLGIKNSSDNKKTEQDCYRMITQGMNDCWQQGKMVFYNSETSTNFFQVRNFDILKGYRKVVEDYVKLLQSRGGSASSYLDGYKNAMIDAIVALHEDGKRKRALSIFKDMHERYPGFTKYKNYNLFIQKERDEDYTSKNTGQSANYLFGSMDIFFKCIVHQRDSEANYYLRKARNIYKRYQKDVKKVKDRRGLPEWNQLFEQLKGVFLQRNPQYKKTLDAGLKEWQARIDQAKKENQPQPEK